MKIAYLGIKGVVPARGGTERVVEALATRMRPLGITPTVYCARRNTPAATKLSGVKIVRLPALPGKYLRATSLDLLSALHAVAFGDYDLIHLHNSEASFVLPLLRLRYRVIATRHGSAYWRDKWGALAKALLRMTDYPFMLLSNAVTSVSAKEAMELAGRFGRAVTYIPNGVGPEYQADLPAAQEILRGHGLDAGGYMLFIAARIEPTKGAHIAVEAANRLGAAAAPLLIVGDDSHVPEYQRRLHDIAGPAIRFQQFVDSPLALFGLMANAQCLILPSLVEAMSMVLLEAASLGLPIVCSAIAENREVMGDDALYFPPQDTAVLTAQLRWVLAHPQEIRAMGLRAQKRIHEEYSWDAIAARYARLYRGLSKKDLAP